MANYNVYECLTDNLYVVSASTLFIGDLIGFYYGEDIKCGTVMEETSNSHDGIYASSFTSCCDCLVNLYDVINFRFVGCSGYTVYDIEATNFCSSYGAPTSGDTFSLSYSGGPHFCATFKELAPDGITNYDYYAGPFVDCSSCPRAPIETESGQYEYVVINVSDQPCGECTSSITPHPNYTALNGDTVYQISAVALGGFNGLNN